jgi:ssDNA-binding Zn-finger/Zn-ribbon topoisomerase 1
MIEKINNTYKIICNSCGEIFEEEFDTFYDAVNYKKSNGWRSVKVSEDNWNEICPDCVEFEKRLKAKGNINV